METYDEVGKIPEKHMQAIRVRAKLCKKSLMVSTPAITTKELMEEEVSIEHKMILDLQRRVEKLEQEVRDLSSVTQTFVAEEEPTIGETMETMVWGEEMQEAGILGQMVQKMEEEKSPEQILLKAKAVWGEENPEVRL